MKITVLKDEEEYPDVTFLPICGVCQPKITLHKDEIRFDFDGSYGLEYVEDVAQSVQNAKIIAEYVRDNLQNLIS